MKRRAPVIEGEMPPHLLRFTMADWPDPETGRPVANHLEHRRARRRWSDEGHAWLRAAGRNAAEWYGLTHPRIDR